MSAPCRSSKARLPAAAGPYTPGTRGRPSAGLLGRVADALLTQTPTGSLKSLLFKALGRRLTTLAPRKHLENTGTAPGQWPGPSRFHQPCPASAGGPLFEFDLRPRLFQSSLDLLGFFLAHAFLDRLRRGFNQVLRFLQSERSDGAHFLDHFDLLVADRSKDNAKLRLLLDRSGGCSPAGRSGGDRHRGGGGDAPFAFKQFGELGGLQDREAREFVDDFFEIGH